jgi:hypothetical protein
VSVSLAAGSYHWVVSYTGDANNNAPLDVTNEIFTVGKANPTLATTILSPIGAVTAGSVTVQDRATIAGGFNPTGTITFDLFTGTSGGVAVPGTHSTSTVSGNGNYDTPANVSVSLAAGSYHWVVSYTGDANNNAPVDVTNEIFTVGKASPTLATTILSPVGSVTAGNVTVQDRATIANGFNPTGTITFDLFTGTSGGAAVPGTHSTSTVAGNGNYDTPANVSVSLAAGSYHWVVSYTGDANNNAPVDVTNEIFTVGKASPTLATTILQPVGVVTAGSVTVQDRATIAGGFNPTGTITFDLFTGTSGGAAVAGTHSTSTVNGNGNYDTTPVSVVLATGSYHWVVSYTGDANNNAPVDVTNEIFTVGKASPTLATTILQPVGSVTAGSVTVQDRATIANGFNPTGTVTFDLFTGTSGGAAVPGTHSTSTVSGNGNYDTPANVSVSLAAGSYHWVVSYTGDANNNAPVDVTNEIFTVGKASPTLATTILQPVGVVTAGSVTVQDRATIANGFNPTGTVTFDLFTGTSGGAAVPGTHFTATVGGNGNYDTTPVSVVLVTGSYHWVVSYTGDANNNAPVDVTNEIFAVGKASPTLATTILSPISAVTAGSVTVQDRATIAGGFNPTGTVTFDLFTGTSGGAAVPGTHSTSTVNGNGSYDTPASVVSLAAGSYHWVVSYTGDANNNAPVDVTTEIFTVGKASPTLATTILSPISAVTAGSVTVQDRATIANGFNPTGTVTFDLFTGTSGGAAVPGTHSTSTVSGNGNYDTPANVSVSLAAGSYHWVVSYTGDANNNAPVDVTNEIFTVGKASPTLATTILSPAGAVTAGSVTVQDRATIANGFNPTGTVTFDLFTGTSGGVAVPGTHSTSTVSGNGNYDTPANVSVSLAAGSYHWVVSYTGDANNNAPVDVTNEIFTVGKASPTLATTILQPAGAVTAGSVTVQDRATIASGFNPTGTITFDLFTGTSGGVAVPGTHFTATAAGNGNYDTPANVSVSLAAGSYHWVVSYTGDANNNAPVDVTNEIFAVGQAPPSIVTTPSPTDITLGTTQVTLNDAANLSGGFNPTGTITFTLVFNGSTVYTDVVTVNGNGVYTTAQGNNPGGYVTPSNTTVTGTYQWNAVYSGDVNNNPFSDINADNEQVHVRPTSPPNESLLTTANPTGTVTLGTSIVTLNDSAVLSGGYFPTGSITFTLSYNGNTVDTETVQVNGNGTYSTPTGYTLPTSTTVTGTYTWHAVYSGDGNNNPAQDQGGAQESILVNPAHPTIMTTPGGTVVVGTGIPLNDTADLEGGYFPGGTITFTLYNPSNIAVYTNVVTVNGNGVYDTATEGNNPGGYVPMVAGTYEWVATYSGDGNNVSVASGVGDEPESVVNPNFIVISSDAGSDRGNPLDAPQVQLVDKNTGMILNVTDTTPTTWNDGEIHPGFNPYDSSYQAGVRTAVADVDGDGQVEIITAPGRFYLQEGVAFENEIRIFKLDFTADPEHPGQVLINVHKIGEFSAYPGSTATSVNAGATLPPGQVDGGVQLAVGDVNGDGNNDIVTVPTRGPIEVKVFTHVVNPTDPSFTLYSDFKPADYRPKLFLGGGVVAVADVGKYKGTVKCGKYPDGKAEVIIGNGSGMRSTVEVFNVANVVNHNKPALVKKILPFSNTFRGGMYFDTGDINGDHIADLVIGSGSGGNSMVQAYNGCSWAKIRNFQAYNQLTDPPMVGGDVSPEFSDQQGSQQSPVRVAVLEVPNVEGEGTHLDIVTVQGTDGKSHHIKFWNAATGTLDQHVVNGELVDYVLTEDPNNDFFGANFEEFIAVSGMSSTRPVSPE